MPTPTPNRWPNRLAWFLACATFPLIWVGGMVTTYGAGMAVPDWPSTYGYFLYYPIRSWLAAWDIFLEHGHRTIGIVVGLLTISLALALWRLDGRRWMRWLGVAALVGVCFQGTLGGLRVIMNEVVLADVHGCTAPLFFALTTALVAWTSAAWQTRPAASPHPAARRLWRWSLGVTVILFVQIVLGAQLRHLTRLSGGASVTLWIWLHVLNALAISAGIVWLARAFLKEVPDCKPLARRAVLLAVLFGVQVVLGMVTWITKYGWPAWFVNYVWSLHYTVVAGGRLQATMTTAHVGVGSLTLVTALSLTLWTRRLLSYNETCVHAPSRHP